MHPQSSPLPATKSQSRRTPPQSIEVMHLPDALVKVDLVAFVHGKSVSWVIREVAAGRLPPPAIRGHRTTRWRVRDVMAHLRGEWQPAADK